MKPDEPRRPDPDALLLEAAKAGRGRLKVFLGMAPGVGKTYEMLAQAARRKAEGGEVLVGIVETHGRRETEALTANLEILPRKPIDYKGRSLSEFDIDEALKRRPALLLIDEYAHSNAPGSRHPKRWQDVEELLSAGVNVWTTLNVQHIESLVDLVWKITGVRQRETVPDSAFARADDVELVDITPDELRQRLNEGKVYLPETARTAAVNFFKPENLTALRELALRRMAQTVDDQLLTHMRQRGVEGPWAAGERILVMIGPDSTAQALVRAGRRLSDMMMDAPWTVAYVERPNRPSPDAAGAAKINAAIKLAEQLGGSNVVLTGDDLVGSLLDYARKNNVTQIVVGKSGRSRWRALFGQALIPALAEQVKGAALHIITEEAQPEPEPQAKPAKRPTLAQWRGHIISIAIVGVAGGFAGLVDQFSHGANLAMIFLVSVLISGLAFGLWPAVTAAAVAAFVYNFFFLEPRLSIVIGHPSDVFTFVVFFGVAMTTGWLTGRIRDQALATSRRASAITALLAASRRLSASATREEAAQALAEQLAAATGGEAIVLLPGGEDVEAVAGSPTLKPLGTVDQAAARWAWQHGEPAGAETGTLPSANWTYRPLQGVKARSGVVGFEATAVQGGDGERFVSALIDQGAVALERAEFAADAADAEALRRSDKLRSALLNSVSHDLRTPLSTVLGSATTLLEYEDSLEKPVRRDLLTSIREEAERLNRYVGNLLDMTRLEGGGLNIRNDWVDVRDVLGAALERVSRRLAERKVTRDYPAEMPLVKVDAALLEQALVNILENAIGYSPEDSTIELAAYEDRNNVVLSIEDEGRGIPTAELERVFERFRRMEESSDRGKGAGLGLAISKGFVEAMGGRIAAASPIHEGKGTRILISLRKEPAAANLLRPMHRLRILIVDDEPQMHRFLGPALNAAGYEPIRAETGRQALAEIARKPPDAVVLDLGLPDIDGQEVLQKARAFYEGPIIILSARDREIEKIEALDAGADDYVEKPFRVGELLARLRVAMRRQSRQADAPPPIIHAGDLVIDIPRRLVTRAGDPVHLSPKEYELLVKLAEADGKVLSHKDLLISLWGPAHAEDMQYLRVFIGQLRQKIETDPSAPKLILTQPGIGYRFMADETIRPASA